MARRFFLHGGNLTRFPNNLGLDGLFRVDAEGEDEDEDAELQQALTASMHDSKQQQEPEKRKAALEVIEYVLSLRRNYSYLSWPRASCYTAANLRQQRVQQEIERKSMYLYNQTVQHNARPESKAETKTTVTSMSPFSFQATAQETALPLFTLNGIPHLEQLKSILTKKERQTHNVLINWCNPVIPGGSWLRHGPSTDETTLFTCSTIFPHCLPNELAYHLPLTHASALWIYNVQLLRSHENEAISPHINSTFSSCMLPWTNTNTSNENKENSSLTGHLCDQLVLALQLAQLHSLNIHTHTNLLVSLDPWLKAGCTPIEFGQRLIQALNKFSTQHPRNVVFLQRQCAISFCLNTTSNHDQWKAGIQSVLSSDAKQKQEQEQQARRLREQQQQQKEQQRLSFNSATNTNTNIQAQAPPNAAQRLLEAERKRSLARRALERRLYMQKIVSQHAQQQESKNTSLTERKRTSESKDASIKESKDASFKESKDASIKESKDASLKESKNASLTERKRTSESKNTSFKECQRTSNKERQRTSNKECQRTSNKESKNSSTPRSSQNRQTRQYNNNNCSRPTVSSLQKSKSNHK